MYDFFLIFFCKQYLIYFLKFNFYKIVWENRYIGDRRNDCLISVDGVDLEIREPTPYHKERSKKWFSHKFEGPGLRYELGVTLFILQVHMNVEIGQIQKILSMTLFTNSMSLKG